MSAKDKTKAGPAETAAADISYTVSIPTIETEQSSLSDAVLTEILSGEITEHADGLATLTADSILVPEIHVSIRSVRGEEEYVAELTFSDLVLEDVTAGIAGSVSLGGVSLATDEASSEFGAMSASQFNIAAMLGFYGLTPTISSEFQTLYTDLSLEGGAIRADDIACEIGAVSGAEFRARPLMTSPMDLLAMARALEDEPGETDADLTGQFMRVYADFLTAFETSDIVVEGLSCTGDEDGRPMTFEIAGMTMGGMSPGIYPSVTMRGLNIQVEGDGEMSLDAATFKPMDMSAVISLLENAPEAIDDAWLEENSRLMIPAMEGFAFSGFEMDIPDPEDDAARIAASIAAFDLTLANYVNGIPTRMDMSAEGIKTTLPEDSEDETIVQLRAMGLTEIDAAFRIAGAWDEPSNTIDFEEVSISGVDLGTVAISGLIANASEDLFSLNSNLALAAGMGLALKSLDLNINDAGLSDIILTVASGEVGQDPEAMRPIMAGIAQGTVISMMAGVANAAQLGEVVNSFVSGKTKSLQIGILAKDDPGLSMLDLMQAEEDPASLIGKVDVEATTE
ncbi:hypothetical protein VE26_04645 [Devosia chinhatensis]|uniref:Uncharacterized protein n=1 Tax=Devosia chinhatensis TaxID=429727 RepID=A0A0F5FK52_9HYPH|nr:hypothetical protein VE26_04645 [Devosia chinhatensis]